LKVNNNFKFEKDEELFKYFINLIININNVKYFQIDNIASVISGLSNEYNIIGTVIIDKLFENIYNFLLYKNISYQIIVSKIKFIGELYNYQLLTAEGIIDILFILMFFNNNNNNFNNDDNIRIRLICILLSTSVPYFDNNQHNKKLDRFLLYFKNIF
jgi:regulator of nonsense transcripts 2